jgi:hypothetical protein
MHSICFGKIERELAENLHECTTEQYHYWVQLNLMFQKGHVDYFELKVLWVYHLLGLRYKEGFSTQKQENLGRLIELTDGFYRETKNTVQPELSCAVNLVHYIRVGTRKWQGPKDALADCSVGQFFKGLELVEGYKKTGDKSILVQLLATFYLPVGWGNKPKKRAGNTTGYSITYFKKLEDYYLYGFLWFFVASVEYLTSQDVSLKDGRTYNFSPLFIQTASYKSTGPGAVLFLLAENSVFGDLDKTSSRNVIEVLVFLLEKHYEAERAKKKK